MYLAFWVASGAMAIAWLIALNGLLNLAAAWQTRVRIRIRRPRPVAVLPKALSVLGFALALSGSPAFAQGRPPVPPVRASQDAPAPPWTETGGSSSAPPQPPVPFEALPQVPVSEEGKEVGEMTRGGSHGAAGYDALVTIEDLELGEDGSAPHPAIHGRRGPGRVQPLFPRAKKITELSPAQRLERRDAMRRHPAGRAFRQRQAEGEAQAGSSPQPASSENPGTVAASGPDVRTWTVRAGDSLWAIAGEVLGTDDLVRIARYWPRIHRMNPEISDPNLVFPGQVLRLPEEDVR